MKVNERSVRLSDLADSSFAGSGSGCRGLTVNEFGEEYYVCNGCDSGGQYDPATGALNDAPCKVTGASGREKAITIPILPPTGEALDSKFHGDGGGEKTAGEDYLLQSFELTFLLDSNKVETAPDVDFSNTREFRYIGCFGDGEPRAMPMKPAPIDILFDSIEHCARYCAGTMFVGGVAVFDAIGGGPSTNAPGAPYRNHVVAASDVGLPPAHVDADKARAEVSHDGSSRVYPIEPENVSPPQNPLSDEVTMSYKIVPDTWRLHAEGGPGDGAGIAATFGRSMRAEFACPGGSRALLVDGSHLGVKINVGYTMAHCGLEGCSSNAHYEKTTKIECFNACFAHPECLAFTWADLDEDREHPGKRVCQLYDHAHTHTTERAKLNRDKPAAEVYKQVACLMPPKGTAVKFHYGPAAGGYMPRLSCPAYSYPVGWRDYWHDGASAGGDEVVPAGSTSPPFSCGLWKNCDDRFNARTIGECFLSCRERGAVCKSFAFFPLNAHYSFPGKRLCILYDAVTATLRRGAGVRDHLGHSVYLGAMCAMGHASNMTALSPQNAFPWPAADVVAHGDLQEKRTRRPSQPRLNGACVRFTTNGQKPSNKDPGSNCDMNLPDPVGMGTEVLIDREITGMMLITTLNLGAQYQDAMQVCGI
eukprot:g20164.t1